jgi:anti-anti-sigma regulatory factor
MQDASQTILSFTGSLTIQTIAEAQQMLLGHWALHDTILLDLAEVIDADLTFVQLIEAARATAAQDGKTLGLCGPPPEAVQAVLRRGGFVGGPAEPGTAFWLTH